VSRLPLPAVAAAQEALRAREPPLARVMEATGPCLLRPRARGTHFEALARAIVFQQLAGPAASAIHARLAALLGGRVTAEGVLGMPEHALRSVGLSVAKTASLVDLARAVEDGRVRLGRIGARSDGAIVADLSQVRGVGRWTAEMFLIFQLGRLDVWPVGDLAVRRGYAIAYGLDADPVPAELERLGERFRPYRTIAAWYCWRAVRPVPVQ
jgi:DNA-3-methyladenine glycosylase II